MRMGWALGSPDSSRVKLLGELAGDLFGLTSVGGRPVRMHGLSVVAGAEVSLPAPRGLLIPVWVGGGASMLWAFRTDGVGRVAAAVLPTVRFGVGVSWPAGPGIRLRIGMVMGVELIERGAPIEIHTTAWPATWRRELLPLTFGGQLGVDLGERGLPWVR